MSRPRLLRPMAPDLVALGDQLEAAARRDLVRRRARRQIVLNAVGSLVIAVPIMFSVATAGLRAASPQPLLPEGVSAAVTVVEIEDLEDQQLPRAPVTPLRDVVAKCLDGKDCRIRLFDDAATPFAIDFPPRRG